MVYGILVLSLEESLAPTATAADNSCVISLFYTAEGNNVHRLTRQLAICEEIQRQFVFQLQTKLKGKVDARFVRVNIQNMLVGRSVE
jgi:hypothetical protein